MELAKTQQILAQLYTNSELRKRFFTQPEATGKELGLNLVEVQQLEKLSGREINIFANSLKWKRLGAVRELLPRTAKVLGKSFTALFWEYAETYVPNGIKKHRDDAISFANFLLRVALTENLFPAWVRDLVIYEKTWLSVDQTNSLFHLCWLNHAINQRDIKGKPTIVIWWRFSVRSPFKHRIFNF